MRPPATRAYSTAAPPKRHLSISWMRMTNFVGPYLPTTWMRGWIAVAKGRREDDEGLLYGCDMCNATGKGRMSREGDTTCWQRLMED